MRNSFLSGAAIATAVALATPAHAGNPEGKLQVKIFATGVLADGKIDKIKSVNAATTLGAAAAASLPASTKANDNVVPTVAVEYFFSPSVSVETICCLTSHHVNGTGGLAGAELVKHVMILPATLTLKYHLDAGPIKPYVGVGPTVFFVIDEKPAATAAALGIDRVKMSNEIGLAAQAGVDVALNSSGMNLSVDAKRYWVRPVASFYDNGVLALRTRHKLDPWVISAGLGWRF